MMKPCIGYDFCLSDIHIHEWLSGRMYKIVAATLTAWALAPAAASVLQHLPVRAGFLRVWTRLMKPPGCRWTAAAAATTQEPLSCGQYCYQGADGPHADGVTSLQTCITERGGVTEMSGGTICLGYSCLKVIKATCRFHWVSVREINSKWMWSD